MLIYFSRGYHKAYDRIPTTVQFLQGSGLEIGVDADEFLSLRKIRNNNIVAFDVFTSFK